MKNQRMKTMQVMLYSYFLLKYNNGLMNIQKIINYNAKNKLDFDDAKEIVVDDKSAYKTRKKQSVEAVKKILLKNNSHKHIEYLNSHKKKDDLCDSFMQAMSFYESKNI